MRLGPRIWMGLLSLAALVGLWLNDMQWVPTQTRTPEPSVDEAPPVLSEMWNTSHWDTERAKSTSGDPANCAVLNWMFQLYDPPDRGSPVKWCTRIQPTWSQHYDKYVWVRRRRPEVKWRVFKHTVNYEALPLQLVRPFLQHRCDINEFAETRHVGRKDLEFEVDSSMVSGRGVGLCGTVFSDRLPVPLAEIEPLTLLKGYKVLFVGHSHLRYVARELCVHLGRATQSIAGEQRRQKCPGSRSTDGKRKGDKKVSLTCYKRHANFYYQPVQYELTEGDLPKEASNVSTFTHVIYTRGLWDQIYSATPPTQYIEGLQRSLELLRKTYPEAKVTYYLQHFGNEPSGRKQYGRNCTLMQRQLLYRALNLCGVASVNDRPSSGGSPRVSVFDPWEVTSTRASSIYTDPWGHHYKGPVLRNIIVNLLYHVTCTSSGPYPSIEAVEAESGIGRTCSSLAQEYAANPILHQHCEDPVKQSTKR